MDLLTAMGLFLITGGSTLLGSLPVAFHQYFKKAKWNFWESFGGGVMVSAAIFSLLLPAWGLSQSKHSRFFLAILLGAFFILLMAEIMRKLTANVFHQRAFLFVFVMGLHNVPEGLAVGVNVAGLGWKESLPLSIAIFIQNLPEGFASSMSFLVSGFSVKTALVANGVTALIETLSAYLGHSFVSHSEVGLPFLLAFSGSCMISVVLRELWVKLKSEEPASFSPSGFWFGFSLCAVLDFLL